MADKVNKKRAAMRWLFGLAFLLLIGVIATIAWKASNEAAQRPKITIAAATWAGFGAAFVGIHNHAFPGIDVAYMVVDDLNARHAAFTSGRANILTTSLDLWVQELAEGMHGSPFLVTDESAGGDGIIAKKAIKSESDLKGKRVAFARATPSQYLLYKILDRNHLSISDVQSYPTEDPTIAGQAFLGGAVDAAVTWEPFLTQVREAGKGHVLATSKEFPHTIVDVLVAAPDLAQRTNVLQQFAEGWFRSVAYIKENPREAARMMASGFHTKPDDIEGTMNGIDFAESTQNELFFCGPSPLAKKIFEDAGEFWLAQKIIHRLPEQTLSPAVCNLSVPTPRAAGAQ